MTHIDADIAGSGEVELADRLRGYGPATRITSGRIRKVIREGRAAHERGDLANVRVALQNARYLKAYES